MKRLRILLILFVAVCSVTHVYALRGSARGGSMGIKGGLTFPDMAFSDESYNYLNHSTMYMPNGSLFFEWNMAGGFAIRTEFAYAERGVLLKTDSEADLPDYTYKLRQRYADFRLGFLMYLFNKSNFQPYLFAMPYASYRFDGTYSHGPTNGIKTTERIKKELVMLPDFGVMGGLGFRGVINTRKGNDYFVAVEGNYTLGLWNNFPTYSTKKTDSYGNSVDVGQPSPFASGNPQTQDYVFGKRTNRGFEVALSLAFPFSNFDKKEKEKEEKEKKPKEKKEAPKVVKEPEPVKDTVIPTEEVKPGGIDTTFLTSTTGTPPVEQPQEKPAEKPQVKPIEKPQEKPQKEGPSFKPETEKINNITVKLTPQVANGDLILRFSYSVTSPKINLYGPGDDYAPGAYLYTSSKACEEMLYYVKEKVQNDYAQYFEGENRAVTVRIIGHADPTPIKSTLRYRGEFGECKGAIRQNGVTQKVYLTANSAVKNNHELAYLRTVHVEQFLKEIEVFSDNNENASFKKIAVIKRSNERDKRSVSIEIIIPGAVLDEGW